MEIPPEVQLGSSTHTEHTKWRANSWCTFAKAETPCSVFLLFNLISIVIVAALVDSEPFHT